MDLSYPSTTTPARRTEHHDEVDHQVGRPLGDDAPLLPDDQARHPETDGGGDSSQARPPERLGRTDQVERRCGRCGGGGWRGSERGVADGCWAAPHVDDEGGARGHRDAEGCGGRAGRRHMLTMR
eukprot:1219877-Prymnesium_polylepis.1